MRNRIQEFLPILGYLGALFWVFGLIMLSSLLVTAFYANAGEAEVNPKCFLLPAGLALALGFVLKRRLGFPPIDSRGSMFVCALGWLAVSALGALPLWMGLEGLSYLDAFFEAVSGFTTTGITMLQGLDHMPRSLLFWRSLMQWLGGLGILTFFLAVSFTGNAAQHLFSAESHKIFSKRPAPGLTHTLAILWGIYAGFTALVAILLGAQGVGLYDAVSHAFTALSTGGYSPHDASIDFYRAAGYTHYRTIEYTIILAMLLGGINFFIHYRVLAGGVSALWDNLEMRLFWMIVAVATGLVMLNHAMHALDDSLPDAFRHSLFQVVSILTTTGFATKDINTPYFPALAKQIFLVLMVVGGCVGSTGGGIKVMRIAVLLKMVGRQLKKVLLGRRAVVPVVVDGEIIGPEELRRISALFFAWMILLAFGGATTAFFSELGAIESVSGMFSALGNIGPCYISVEQMTQLHPVVKLTYIAGMLAGRLEILPILLLFMPRAWK